MQFNEIGKLLFMLEFVLYRHSLLCHACSPVYLEHTVYMECILVVHEKLVQSLHLSKSVTSNLLEGHGRQNLNEDEPQKHWLNNQWHSMTFFFWVGV